MSAKLPPPEHAAYFLDFDGTLVEIAPTPMAVTVPPGLVASLQALAARAGGALALVSGRPIAELDALLAVPFSAAGQHGAERRPAPAAAIAHAPLPTPPGTWLSTAERLAAATPGALLERKRHGFALHYRNAPEAGPAFGDALAALLAGQGDFALLPAKMAWEVRPAAAHKGAAVAALMAHPPFAGRTPVYVGDDVTDEDGIAAAEAQGGIGLRVEPDFGSPAAVRAWIAGLCG